MKILNLPITNNKTIPIDYQDIMGHMNVMWYTHIFDVATFNFFNLFNFGADYHTHSGNGSFAIEQHTRYLAEVRIGDSVTVHTRALGRGGKTVHFMHFMVNDANSILAATTELVGIHIDLNIRRSSPLPETVTASFDKMLATHQSLDWEAPVCGAMGP
ncbi:MAG: thioesterase family protein [Anaerolineae bacterium]|nr:thioesterase family protein [Anaerolineae bacterium]